MTIIVTAKFESTSDVDAAMRTLRGAGFRDDELQSFFVGPPGRHDLYPLGGDAHHDEGTKKSGRGALLSAFIGAVCGVAAAALIAMAMPQYWLPILVVGVGIGAYAGSLWGALRAARGGKPNRASPDEPVEDPGGITLAVKADRPFGPAMAVVALRRHGARDIVQTRGNGRTGAGRISIRASRSRDVQPSGSKGQ